MAIDCQYCGSNFKNEITLKSHLANSKKCLKLRGITLETKFMCRGCKSSFMNNVNLSIHCESCKEYNILQATEKLKEENIELLETIEELTTKTNRLNYFEMEIKERDYTISHQEQIIVDLRQVVRDYTDTKDENTTMKLSLQHLQERYSELEVLYERTVNKLEQKISQCDSFIQNLARDGMNKPTTTNNNTVNNQIKNVLSPVYTMETLEQKQIVENLRVGYTENVFNKGQRGLAEHVYKQVIKTPDDKMLLCCCDTSRKKFKLVDINGNLKEDIHARLFCEKMQIPIQTITNEMYKRIEARIEEEQKNTPKDHHSAHDKLIKDMMEAQEIFIEVFNFHDHDSNQEFINELCKLLNVNM